VIFLFFCVFNFGVVFYTHLICVYFEFKKIHIIL
jgi:hypothetical protein